MTQDEYVEAQRKVNTYHRNGQIEHSDEGAPHRARWLAGWIKANRIPAESFLDVGCRTGYSMDTLIEHFPSAEVLGVDIVPEFVETARKRSDAIVADMQRLPLPNLSYDWIFSVASIEHCPAAHEAAEEFLRVAKVGIFIETDLEDEERFKANESHFTRHDDPMEWLDLFRHPDWRLMMVNVPNYRTLQLLLLRKEHAATFRNWENA